jgi:hypothetical protein
MSSHRQMLCASVVAAATLMLLGIPAKPDIATHVLAGAIVGLLSYGGMRLWIACGPQQ